MCRLRFIHFSYNQIAVSKHMLVAQKKYCNIARATDVIIDGLPVEEGAKATVSTVKHLCLAFCKLSVRLISPKARLDNSTKTHSQVSAR